MPIVVTIVLVILFVVVPAAVRILKEYERGVVLTLGKFSGVRGAGLQFIFPVVQTMVRVDQRVITMDVPTQDVITKDNVSVKVNAVVYFRVMDPEKAILKVEDYYYATSQLAQTTLRSVCGEAELDGLLANREEFNHRIQGILDQQTDPWGVKVVLVEVKHIDLPQEMQRAMAKEAEAERERRAKIIKAEGEYQASTKLTDAANVMAANPMTLQLRYLETLRDISAEHNSTIIFPLPLEMFEVLKGAMHQNLAMREVKKTEKA
jgi:regulator of protease activity HflC (stomatin/prohibitin superfamily)